MNAPWMHSGHKYEFRTSKARQELGVIRRKKTEFN